MKKIISVLFINLVLSSFCIAEVISGKIDRFEQNYQNKVIDSKTKNPLNNAKISIPDLNYETYTDSNGVFKLNIDINDKTILFVEKDGYKVFSLTIDNNVLKNPLKLGIEQTSPFDLQISQGVIHLGDNMFSSNSANSGDFRLFANGHFFSKTFKKPTYGQNQDVVVRIGTIIGLDTKKAKELGQNSITTAYSSPAEIFVNGHKIGSLEVNDDNIEVIVPKSILRETNELVVKTGRNLFQDAYIDYDDIELAKIRIETKEHKRYAKYWFVQNKK